MSRRHITVTRAACGTFVTVRMNREVLARFHRFVLPDSGSGCWVWIGPFMPNGYGKYRAGPGQPERPAHRVAYEHYVGQVPAGLQLDHLCRNRACANPQHLEPVTAAVNTDRQDHANRRKDHCPAGHPYPRAADGTWIRGTDGRRRCRVCRRAAPAR